MTFNMFPIRTKNSTNTPVKPSLTRKALCMIDTPLEKNSTPYKSFDCSIFDKDDVVLLMDGDWLAFSATAKEMERYLHYENNGNILEFSGYTKYKEYCLENGIEYSVKDVVKKQRNHDMAVAFAKSSVKKKIAKFVEEAKATKVVLFLGSDGNSRDLLPLPKLNDVDNFKYKGFREPEWIPDTLPEIKHWMLTNWLSHWSVGIETDDDITVTKTELDALGIKNYLIGIDKDFLGERIGGICIVSHHNSLQYHENTPENNLGWIKVVKTEGGSTKMTGRGDMFLAYQCCSSDPSDNYFAKDMLKKYGTLGKFGLKACEKYLMQAKSVEELWQLVYDFFNNHLPQSFEYEDCFGNIQQASPLSMLSLYYKCAKMREKGDVEPDVVRDRLIPLNVKYEGVL